MAHHANTTEILEAYSNLSDDELLALKHCARKLLDGTRFSEPLDLVHEALHRSLDGRRNWPMDVDFGCYMAMTMRSVASGDRKKFDNKRAATLSFDDLSEAYCGERLLSKSAEDAASDAEQSRIALSAAEAARISFAGDDAALSVLSGLLDGLSPSETCDAFQIDSKSFDSARHRVMRRIKSMAKNHSAQLH